MDPVSEILDEKGRNVFTVSAEATVSEAVLKMCAHKVGALLVTDGELPVASFTERDVMSRVIANDWDPKRTRVRDVMTHDVVCIYPDTEAADAMKLMTKNRCRHLPVVAGGRLVGIVSMGDLVSWMGRSQALELSMLRDLVTYGHLRSVLAGSATRAVSARRRRAPCGFVLLGGSPRRGACADVGSAAGRAAGWRDGFARCGGSVGRGCATDAISQPLTLVRDLPVQG